MKTNKFEKLTKIVLIFVGLVFFTSGSVLAQSSQSPASQDGETTTNNSGTSENGSDVDPEDLISTDPYIYPDGYVEPTSPSVGVVIDIENMPVKNTAIFPDSREPMGKQVVPDLGEENMFPSYELNNFTRADVGPGKVFTIKVVTEDGPMLDSKPLFKDTGNPEQDKIDYENAISDWEDDNDLL